MYLAVGSTVRLHAPLLAAAAAYDSGRVDEINQPTSQLTVDDVWMEKLFKFVRLRINYYYFLYNFSLSLSLCIFSHSFFCIYIHSWREKNRKKERKNRWNMAIDAT